MRLLYRLAFLGALFASFLTLQSNARASFPSFTSRIVDDAHLITALDKGSTIVGLDKFQAETGVQFVVVTVQSLDGMQIEDYARELFNQWGVGRKGVNDGLMLLIAPNEHRLRFEVGRGLQKYMNDEQTKEILHTRIVPLMKIGETSAAIREGVLYARNLVYASMQKEKADSEQQARDDPRSKAMKECGNAPEVSGGPWLSSTYSIAANDEVRRSMQEGVFLCVKTVEYVSPAVNPFGGKAARVKLVGFDARNFSRLFQIRDMPY